MVIDTSALPAILFDEPERRSFNEKIEADPVLAALEHSLPAVGTTRALIRVSSRRDFGGAEETAL